MDRDVLDNGIDLIGDVHGHASRLTALLETLGYRHRNGTWAHRSRSAIFLGDLIDRGPEQLETVNLVRSMVDAGSARCVMGNHEYNAIAWATEDDRHPGRFLRSHTPAHRRQHQAFLSAVGDGSPVHRELIDWFTTLPLWLDLGSARVVHACWDPDSQAVLAGLGNQGLLDRQALALTARRGHQAFDALEVLLKGPEAPLPTGFSYMDKDGIRRTRARFAWWLDPPGSLGQALMFPGELLGPDDEPAGELDALPLQELPCPPYTEQVPLFIGHYWRTGLPAPLTSSVVCVDFSAGRGGPLAAYRFDGEAELSPDRFVLV